MSTQDYIFDLGSYHRRITSRNDDAQTWFDRGLIWAYAFNHEESASCFERAIKADSNCAMAYWGLAYCVGPNYNKPWSYFDEKDLAAVVQRGHEAAKLAEANTDGITPVEKALIKAVQYRYPAEKPEGAEACVHWNQGFADAMEEVYKEFPDDLDVITLYVDAVMNLHPWNMWDLKTCEPTEGARTIEMKNLLDHALTLDGALKHPGLLHMYIHLMEMSPSPESALPIADHLRGLVPDGGHLHHMPTHLDVLCGQYEQAITSNSDAIVADERFLSQAGPINFYTLYRAHDYHFRVYAAMFAGKYQVAIETVERLESSMPKSLLQVESPPMADWLEAFLTLRAHVLIRFGRWEDLVNLELPEDQQLYCMTTAITHYAKGVAFAASGRVKEAEDQRRLFQDAAQKVAPSRTLFNNTCSDILQVAEAMLDGELEYRLGHFDAAYEHLRKAIDREDNLPYDEPWGWMQPTRHAYGALLLEQGHVEKALEVYMADLGMTDTLPRALRHENNVWALHGVHECLLKLGRESEAKELEGKLSAAVAAADVPVHASCFCRLETESKCKSSGACKA
ncbi:hypothetical protein NW755_006045 [Fusarium falciforme]|uniref:TPR domain protein n=1 Tax=Fusarium falciforme TaxID=195108 RepID=A0A9W8V065_9HYPO|nr:hypothetical protein NW755_006045 [Fusarium falciforme]